MRLRLAALIACLTLGLSGVQARQNQASVLTSSPLESYLESLRAQAGIPGMSAAIVQDGAIVWEHGFGYQNQESRQRATPDTPYLVANISETIAAALVLKCAEERRLSIDDPIRRYGGVVPDESATIRQVLSHTSAGSGEAFRYDAERYAQLTPVVENCVPQPYRKTVAANILERLAMKDSVPGRDLTDSAVLTERLFSTEVTDRYQKVLERIALPYKVDKRGRATRTDVAVEGINAATGLVTTVRDYARFDAAIDADVLLRDETRVAIWSPDTTDLGTVLPTGLGWFVQTYKGEPVVWHFGIIANGYSSLVVKLPARHLTFILFANSDGLSSTFQLDQGDVTRSLFATLFLRLFT